jgi:hypothetical protein
MGIAKVTGPRMKPVAERLAGAETTARERPRVFAKQ